VGQRRRRPRQWFNDFGWGLTVDSAGNMYVSDMIQERIVVLNQGVLAVANYAVNPCTLIVQDNTGSNGLAIGSINGYGRNDELLRVERPVQFDREPASPGH